MTRAAAALLLAALAAAPAAAFRPLTPPAPEFPAGDAWLNAAQPLPLSLLKKRKAVVVAFLDPTDLHSIRVIPVLKAWFERYALSQLMVIGVVTPRLDVQKDAVWVRRQVERDGIEFPVVLDTDRRLWDAYGARGWPALFLVDRRGRVVYDHLGEGGYGDFESQIRQALGELVDWDDLPPAVSYPDPKSSGCGRSTPDVPMGARAKTPIRRLDEDYSLHRMLMTESRQGELATRGRWELEPDGMRLDQKNPVQTAFVRVVFEATQALAVLAPPPDGSPTRFFVKMDDQWLYQGEQGRDVRFDDDGRSYVTVREERLYDLARARGEQPHMLAVIPDRRGGGVFGFQFADACLATDLP
ncbi:MAG: redoxin domain-containing protein [Elusimicrobia bacterium]|nr:redoxin domain-containing protein [Elusimicrobiota bacterium]